jgi:hypothetical protein
MPLHWTLDHDAKLVSVVAEGDVHKGDLLTYLALISRAGLGHWRKLFDARLSRPVISFPDVNDLGALIRSADAIGRPGALAFVTPRCEATPELMRLLGFWSVATHPMRLFHDRAAAQKWINTQRMASECAARCRPIRQ